MSRLERHEHSREAMFSRRIVRISVMLALAAFGSALAHPVARAEGGDTTEKVTQLNRDALAAIDKREFEKARELLKRALDVCQGAGLEQHPIAARTHIHMGVVIIRGFKNHELGSKQFAKALAIEPNISVTKSVSTPDVEEVFADVKAGVGASAGSGSAAGAVTTSGAAAGAKKSPARDAGAGGAACRRRRRRVSATTRSARSSRAPASSSRSPSRSR